MSRGGDDEAMSDVGTKNFLRGNFRKEKDPVMVRVVQEHSFDRHQKGSSFLSVPGSRGRRGRRKLEVLIHSRSSRTTEIERES